MVEERSESSSSRYRLIHKVASGGVATVWVGAVRGGLGFRQLVAIKKPHPHLFELPSLRSELITEARLASMIQHGNVVDVRDVDVVGDQINLVMDYIEGASLADLLRAAKDAEVTVPTKVVLRIILDSCAGLHAAHELVDENGKPAALVHRDVSPQNILVGLDGISRVTDFGIAKATRASGEQTDSSLVKGKLAYMSPEYITGKGCDRRLDVFALGTVCWEALAGERCFKGESDLDTADRILRVPARPLSQVAPAVGTSLDDVLAMAMERSVHLRFPTMRAFATALEGAGASIGTHADVAATVASLLGPMLLERRAKVRAALADEAPAPDLRASAPSLPAASSDSSKSADRKPLDSGTAEPVSVSAAPAPAAPAPDIEPDRESSAPHELGAVLGERRRPLKLVVAVVCGVAVLVALIGAAVSRTPSSTVGASPRASTPAPPSASPPPSAAVTREDPIPPPPPADPAPAETASARPDQTGPAPRPGPRPIGRPPATPSTRPGKPVPPNPYGH